MKPMQHALTIGATIFLLGAAASAFANDAQDCATAGGSLLTGEVITAPTFKSGMFRKGVELSHTHLTLKGANDGRNYDVAIDNVFADGYQKNRKGVPAPLNTINVGDKLEVCGIPFQGGIHWVHNNCGDHPTQSDPNGWIKKVQADGTLGPNMEDNEKFCYLWPRR